MVGDSLASSDKRSFRIYGIPWQVFLIFSAVLLIAVYLEKLPKGMVGAFPLMIFLGAVFGMIGDNTPIIRSFLGGGAIVCIFGAAALNTFKIFPESAVKIMGSFMTTEGFLDFYIAALITGSIMGMNRTLLIKAAIRYFPALLGGLVVSLAGVAAVGAFIGYGGKEAVLYIGIPIMGGGMGAGAVPLAQIFGTTLSQEPKTVLSIMVPAVALGNALSIVMGGLLNRLGKVIKGLSGEGQLMRVASNEAAALEVSEEYRKARDLIQLPQMGAGLLIATGFFAFGAIVNKFVPGIHGYAWMIITVAVVKALGFMPEKLEICCYQWFQFVMINLTGVLLVGIGISYTNLMEIYSALSVNYLLLVFVTVLGAVVGAGLLGWLVGFYPIESSITAGLCMANMGGTGDVAVLSAARRMELMPFAQISSRIGGAFILILASLLLKML
ncbi:MAG: 2-hydroxycarboxylate transporter family protein [Synergistaceae bacterium]|jgi:Na+/citrate or Na+/malate symporter|nr:2-hydroxycarboxylate transporter family protein [Synergistaceae bacterium]